MSFATAWIAAGFLAGLIFRCFGWAVSVKRLRSFIG